MLGFSVSTLLVASASAQLQWDPLGGAAGAQGGQGNWLTSNGGSPWWDGINNVAWIDGGDAVFSAGSGAVTASGVTVDDLTATVPSLYTISGSISFGMGDGIHTISNAADLSISASIAGTEGFVKQGPGQLYISGTNTFSGPVIINEGTLRVGHGGVLNTANSISIAAGASFVSGPFVSLPRIGSLSGAGSVDINGTLEVGGNNMSTIFAGSISGNAPARLIKTGSGTLTLTGANTYGTSFPDATIIQGGVLEVGGGNAIPDSTGVTVSPGATMRLIQNETINNLNGGGAVELGSNALTLRFGGGTFSGIISGSGSVAAIGGIHTLTGTNTFAGGLTLAGGNVNAPDFGSDGTNGPLGPGPVTIDGGGLGYSGAGTMSTNRSFSITSKGATFSGNDGKLVVNSLLGGTGQIKVQFGVVELTNPGNSFTGGIYIQSGALAISDVPDNGPTSTIGASGPITFGPGGRLLFTGTGSDSSDRTMVYTSSGFGVATIEVPAGAALTLNSATGAGGLLKSGPGTLIQTNASNDFAGNVEIRDGVLLTGSLENSGTPSALGAGNTITLGGPNTIGHLRLPDGVNSTSNRNIGGSGQISISNSTVTLNGATTGNIKFSGSNAPSDTFILNGQSGGATIIDRVKLQVGSGFGGPVELVDNTGAQLEFRSGVPSVVAGIGTLHGGAGPNFGRVILGGSLRIAADLDGTFFGVIEGVGDVRFEGWGTSTLAGINTFSGNVTILGGRVAIADVGNIGVPSHLGAGAILQLARDAVSPGATLIFTGTSTDTTNRTLLLQSSDSRIDVTNENGTLVWSGPVNGNISSSTEVALIKGGVGTLRLTGANDYVGITQITEGKLQVLGSSAIPDLGRVIVSTGAALELLPGTNETIGSVEGSGSIVLGGQRLVTGVNGRASTFSGVISGTAGSSLEKRGAGEFFLTNPNSSFAGGLIVTEGAVNTPFVANIGTNSPIGSNGPIALGGAMNTGRLIVSNVGSNSTNRPIQVSQGSGIIETRNSGSEVVLTGTISGSSSFVKLGPGRLTLSGDKNFAGSLVVADGTLRLDGSVAGTPVTVIDPGILDSADSTPRTMGTLTLAGGLVSPGLPGETGVFNTGDVILGSGGLAVDLKSLVTTGYDHLNATGVVSFDGVINLSINLGYDPEDFVGVFPIIVNDGTDVTTLNGESARFAYNGMILDEGRQFMVESNSFRQLFEIRYGLTPEENDVRLIVVPEPNSAFLIAIGALVVGLRRKERCQGRQKPHETKL